MLLLDEPTRGIDVASKSQLYELFDRLAAGNSTENRRPRGILMVSSYLPDLYVGDFFERLNRLPVRPCSIIMNEGRTPAATISEMKSMIGEVKCQ